MGKPERSPLRFALRQSDDVIDLEFAGYLDEADVSPREQLDAALKTTTTRTGLCVTLAKLEGFHRSQVGAFAQVFIAHHKLLLGVALVGATTAARFAAITAGVMAQLPVRAFDTRSEATEWLETLTKEKK